MVSISHGNRYYWLRVPVIPFVFFSYLLKYLSCKKITKKYVLNKLHDLSLEERYDRFFSFFERGLFMKNLEYTYIFKKKLLQNQTIFVVNENINWNTIGFLREIVKKKGILYPRFLLNNLLVKNRVSIFWDLIDTFYGVNDLNIAISSKRSLIIEKDLLDKFPESLDIIKSSYLPVIPVFCKKIGLKIFFVTGDVIRTGSLIRVSKESFKDLLHSSFKNLESVKLEFKKNKFNIKDLFSI